MGRAKKLRLSADTQHGYGFRQGLFVRLYEQGLYWFVVHVKPLKPMLERVKGGEPLVYGGLPVSSFEALTTQGTLQWTEATEYGWKWPYAQQTQGAGEDFSGFPAWRETALAAEPLLKSSSANGRNILREIRAFNLAGSTPMQAMSAVAEWQEYLRNWEGAG